MKKVMLLAICSLLIILWQIPYDSFAEEMRLDPNVAPTFQAIELNLDAQKTEYSGSVRIELQVKESTTTFRFHAEEMNLTRLELRDQKGPVDLVFGSGDNGLIYVTTKNKLSLGSYSLEIDFNKDYNTKAIGLYRMEQDGTGYLFTQFEAVDARKAFPCWDEPIYKSPFQMTIHIPEGQEAVTNTPIATEDVSSTMKTLVFHKTKPLPTYLLAIAAGPLESVPMSGLSIPGRVYTIRGQKHLATLAAEITAPILTALEKYFDSSYPYAKLDFIAIPEYWPGAMENPGAVTYVDRILLIDKEAATVSQKRRLAYVTAHELAHMWFGDLVTMAWWDDLWLNESFADWLGEKVAHDLFPDYKIDIDEIQDLQGQLRRDARPSTRPIKRTVVSASDIMEDLGLAYGKGKKVLGMVEQWIGTVNFRKGVLNYIEKHSWGNATADDLWNALSDASGKNVQAVLSSYLEQSGYPMVEVKAHPNGVLKISQRRFLNYGVEAPAQKWSVPLRLKYSDGETTETVSILLDKESKTVELNKNLKWVMPDAGAFGYYRWTVPNDMLFYLAENAEQLLTERERVAFLGNTSALLDAGVIGGDAFLTSINGFAKSTDPGIISTLLSDLKKLKNAFVPEELRNQFAYYVRKTLRPALDHFGMQPRENEDSAISLLRPSLISWLGREGQDREVSDYAKSLAKSYMADPKSIDPSLAGVALRIAAIEGDDEDFQAYKKKFENAQVPADRGRYLSGLGTFANKKLQDEALKYTLEGPLRTNEIFNIPRTIGRSGNNKDYIYEWMTTNYENITSRLPKEFVAFMPFYAGGCSEERLEKAKVFFSDPEHNVEGTDKNLAKVTDQVTDCVNLRNREEAAVSKYLNQLAETSSR